MSRDLKRPLSTSATRAPARKSGGGTLVGIVIGLVLGVGAALAVVLYINKAPTPFVDKTQPPAKESKDAAGTLANVKPGAATGAAASPELLPGKPGDPVPEKRFQFYDILPGKAEPKSEPVETKSAETKPVAKDEKDAQEGKAPAKSVTLFLQTGSFQKSGEADNQKASLAMLGMEAAVQQVMVGDKVWYRVRLGPYDKLDEVNRVRAELAKAGIEASVTRNKD